MIIRLHDDTGVKVAHLIPTRGRWALMEKALPKMQAVWNRPGTYLAIENREFKKYRQLLAACPKIIPVRFDNPTACIGNALEVLRRAATGAKYDYYVLSDDNCRFTNESMTNLVRATAEYGKPVHMAGSHGTAAFFDKGRMRRTMVTKHGIRTYRKMAWILRCVPHHLYARFEYPKDLPCYSDRYYTMWLIQQGHLEFRCTPDAPFSKKRFVAGGIGEKETRNRAGIGLSMLARDFADVLGPLEVRIPWEEILKLNMRRKENRRKRIVLRS